MAVHVAKKHHALHLAESILPEERLFFVINRHGALGKRCGYVGNGERGKLLLRVAEGIFIGASQAQVEAAYGADAFNGSNAYIVTRDDGTLTVILEDGLVSSIQYAIIVQ